jgi:hypothetical protein
MGPDFKNKSSIPGLLMFVRILLSENPTIHNDNMKIFYLNGRDHSEDLGVDGSIILD